MSDSGNLNREREQTTPVPARVFSWQFATLRGRLLCFLLALISLILLAVYVAVDIANTNNARRIIKDSLDISANTFLRQIELRSRHLIESTRLLSGDFAFKQAFFSRDVATVLSALKNQQRRIGADVMMVASLQGEVLANTLRTDKAMDYAHDALLQLARDNPEQTGAMLVLIDAVPYQLVAVPLLAPIPRGWFLLGFRIDNDFARRLEKDTRTHISLAFNIRGEWLLYASTLGKKHNTALLQHLRTRQWQPMTSIPLTIQHQAFIIEALQLQADTPTPVLVVLQQSLDEALAPYQRIRTLLSMIVAGAFGVALIGGHLISRSITEPVKQLAQFAQAVQQGNYNQQLRIERRDEVGHLVNAFNHMSKGLRERDQVRNLLGKVVSPQIAQELLQKNIELGGEEKEVTVLFSDIRDFTTLSESMPPKQLLELLNRYLTAMSQGIEAQAGVIDKYIGDAIMALFGAPLTLENGARHAVQAAFAMCDALRALNTQLSREGHPPLTTGIGINTGKVVAGNMGSRQRLNYSVIGDAVNLASRLESITKYYGVPIIVSEATKRQADNVVYQELDLVRVKGKQQAVAIYAPLCLRSAMSGELQRQLETFSAALTHYRLQEWAAATRYFRDLLKQHPRQRLYQLYLQRIDEHQSVSPGRNWDGSYAFQQK